MMMTSLSSCQPWWHCHRYCTGYVCISSSFGSSAVHFRSRHRLRYDRSAPVIIVTYPPALDPIPVLVLKAVVDLHVPFLTYLFNHSLTAGCVSAGFKDSFVTSIIKTPRLNEGNPSFYRLISNLSLILKLLWRFVAWQLVTYFSTHCLLPATQSGFRRGHSTETATICVLSHILDAVDRGDNAAVVLLDLTVAFDTVDHEILLERLWVTFGMYNSVLAWFWSTTYVICGNVINVDGEVAVSIIAWHGSSNMGGGAKVALSENAEVMDSTDWFNLRTSDRVHPAGYVVDDERC